MTRKTALLAATTAVLALSQPGAFASGFRLPDESVKAMAMANAYSAQADDASANWYNPAALVWQEGRKTELGEVFIYPTMEHTTASGKTEESDTVWHGQPNAYYSQSFGDYALGFGMTAPFGLSTNWGNGSTSANVATYSNLKVINYNLNGAIKLSDSVSIAAGFNMATIDAWLYNYYSSVSTEVKITGNGTGVGYNAALFYKATPELNLGLSYRSRMVMAIKGTLAQFTPLGTASYDADTTLVLPDILLIGGSYKATDKLRINADLDYTGWSSYDTLDIHYNNTTNSSMRDWHNVWAVRVGGEYAVAENWKARLGWLYDASPVSDGRFEPRIPDSDRMGYSAGVGYEKNAFSLNASYMYLNFAERTITNSYGGGSTPISSLNGDWKMRAQLVSISATYKF